MRNAAPRACSFRLQYRRRADSAPAAVESAESARAPISERKLQACVRHITLLRRKSWQPRACSVCRSRRSWYIATVGDWIGRLNAQQPHTKHNNLDRQGLIRDCQTMNIAMTDILSAWRPLRRRPQAGETLRTCRFGNLASFSSWRPPRSYVFASNRGPSLQDLPGGFFFARTILPWSTTKEDERLTKMGFRG